MLCSVKTNQHALEAKKPPTQGRLPRIAHLYDLEYPQNQPKHHAGRDAEHQHRPRHREELGAQAGDEALCLCQVRQCH